MNLKMLESRRHVIASGEINGDAYLILSYLEEGGRGSQRELGQLVENA